MSGITRVFNFLINGNLGSGFGATFGSASKRINELTKDLGKLSKMGKDADLSGALNKKLKSISAPGVYFGAIGLAKNIAGGMMEASKAAIDFESNMADVRKVVDFDTPEQFKEMGKDILEMSNNIPMAANDIAKIVAAGGQSGIAREDLTSFAESAAKMGVAFDVSADQAGDMMAKWRTAFKMNQDQVVDLADKINYLGNTTAASSPLISDVVTRIGPLGAIGGVASGEIAALGASMVGSGIESDVAATGIKSLILALTSGKSATKSQSEAFAELGMNAEDVAQSMQTDAKGAILQVLTAISSLDKVDQASILSNLFGKESLGAIAPLLSNLDGLKDNLDKVGDSANYAGSMENEFSTRSKTTANSLQLMKNRADNAKIAIGNGLIPVITPYLELLGKGIGIVANFTQEYPKVASIFGMLVLSFGTLAGAVGVIGTISSSVSAIVSFGKAARAASLFTKAWAAVQWVLNAAFMANPIGMVIAGIVALIAIGYVLYSNWEEISAFASSMWEGAKTAISDFATLAEQKIGEAYDWIMQKWEGLKSFLSHPIDFLVRYNTEQREAAQGEDVGSNAIGGIYKQGAFLTTFAEDSPEAAIPINGSARSAGLWARTGEAMGLLDRRNNSVTRKQQNPVSIEFKPNITIQGNADEKVVQNAMTVTMDQLKRMLRDLQMNERRLSYE